MSQLRPYGPGKFNTLLDSCVYGASLDGGPDEECGDSSTGSAWYGLLRAPLTVEYPDTLTPEERAYLAQQAGAILIESSIGLVYVDYYVNAQELEAEWARIQDEHEGDE